MRGPKILKKTHPDLIILMDNVKTNNFMAHISAKYSLSA